MSVRLSFGSRAGGSTDYQGGSNSPGFFSRGPFDSLDALGEALRNEIHAAEQSSVPECTTVELSLSFGATLALHRPTIGPYASGGEHDLPEKFRVNHDGTTCEQGAHPRTTVGSIVNVNDGRSRQIVQRAASRGIIQAVEAADGYRYSFNNAWTAKDEEGSRFSYICQDSMQNKDRHANGFTRTLKHLKGEGERGPRKPTYDCKGSVSVKFSSGRQRVDVYYRHYAIHQTVAERKPPARPPPRPRVQKESGGLAAELQRETSNQAEQYASSALQMVNNPYQESPLAARSENSNIGRPLKRKRDYGPLAAMQTPRDPNKTLSLMELLKQSDTANAPTPASETAKPKLSNTAPPVNYELPSWQTPPPNLNKPTTNAPYQPPYPPPYQPTNQRQAAPQQRQPKQAPPGSQRSKQSSSQAPAQGLFTTMKPVNKDEYRITTPQTWQTPQTYFQPVQRAKTSCTHCRIGKKKCDEGHPCGSCIRSGRDCMYEGGPPHHQVSGTSPQHATSHATPTGSWGNMSSMPSPSNGWQSTPTYSSRPSSSQAYGSQRFVPGQQSSPPLAWSGGANPKSGATADKEESPDPWFPRR
ncbi:hypothetical protein AC579_2969 [Lecanosticta acicola]|uniref:Zn(2)-C6 fungal-type domain-containing protein n=1 Tax=Lecanosticta acicola TaxID=111012 RepID=A0AAI8Z0M0_9PEZI|nr:hypothetical protein AC579_2969 [Lecanosticta acicola]